MIVLAWVLLILLILSLILVILFLFYFLLPTISDENVARKNPVFSDKELNYALPKDEEIEVSDKRAVVLCNPNKEFKEQPRSFNKMHSCRVANAVFTSASDCGFACVGLGDCVKACPQEAIDIINHTAVVSNLCIGCGKCVSACPKGIIRLFPKRQENIILCCNSDQTLTTCTTLRKEEKIERKEKKDFKIWSYCYRMIKH